MWGAALSSQPTRTLPYGPIGAVSLSARLVNNEARIRFPLSQAIEYKAIKSFIHSFIDLRRANSGKYRNAAKAQSWSSWYECFDLGCWHVDLHLYFCLNNVPIMASWCCAYLDILKIAILIIVFHSAWAQRGLYSCIGIDPHQSRVVFI